jgi:hypothetical protein
VTDVVAKEPQPPPPPPPRTIDDLPPEVRDRLKARMEASEEYTDGCERKAALRRRWATTGGSVVAGAMALLIGADNWVFPVLTTVIGAWAACLVVRRECEALGGALIYGGSTVFFTLVAHCIGLVKLNRGDSMLSALDNRFLFAWAVLLGVGALIAFLAEQDRSLNAGG